MKKQKTGFTLIELMIVVAIIGILSTMAVPTFHHYIVRSQIKEGLELSTRVREAVSGYYLAQRSFPADNPSTGVPLPEHLIGNYVTGIEVAEGAIHVTFGNRVNARLKGKVVSLRPAYVTDSPDSPISWICGYAEAVDGMSAQGENKTDIQPFYLSADCRAWKGNE